MVADSAADNADDERAWQERYARQILLKEVGGHGQKRLDQATVGVVGTGAVGTPLLLYLAAAGVGHLVLIATQARVVAYQGAQPLEPVQQAERLQKSIDSLNPTVQTTLLDAPWQVDQLRAAMRRCDIILLADHQPEVRRTVNAMAWQLGTPFLGCGYRAPCHTIAASRTGRDPNRACPSDPNLTRMPSTSSSLALPDEGPGGPLVHMALGMVGTVLAMETLKILLGAGEQLWHAVLAFDPIHGAYRRELPKNDALLICPLCHGYHDDESMD